MSGLQYLPRQDGGVNGTIKDYQVHVSPDCATWTQVAAGTWAANTTLKTATFSGGSGSGNTAPTVTISSPTSGASFTTNDSVTLTGTASDTQDGNLSASLSWSSNLDGPLGQGASFGVWLSAGTHTLTAAVTDSGGLSQSRSVQVAVTDTSGALLASCVRLTALSEINGKAWTSAAEIGVLDGQGQALSRAGWTVAGFDSQELVGENGRATNAIDGQTGTIWHTQWKGASPPPPHYIAINLGQQRTVSGLQYLPRQDGGVNGTIKDYQVHVSPDCATWTQVAAGTWAANTTLKTATFSGGSGSGNTAPTVTISSPTSGASFTTNDSVTLTGTASDTQDGNLSASLSWSSNLDGPLGQGASFGVWLSAGTHTLTAAVTDSGGLSQSRSVQVAVTDTSGALLASCVRLTALSEINGKAWTSAAEISVLDGQGQALSRAGWTVAGFDSQELWTGESAPATNAIDGSSSSFWHTRWYGINPDPPPPHYIAINLGQQRTVSGLQYLPRQDGGVNGTIKDYQVHVSQDCATWTQVAAGTWAGNTTLKTAAF